MGSDAQIRIGELSRRTGVSADLLRAWEHRYGLLDPVRTEGGFRLYSARDVEQVQAMTRRLAEGFPAAVAAKLTLADPGEGTPSPDAAASQVVVQPLEVAAALRRSLDAFDEEAAHAALDRALATYSLTTALGEVVLPYLSELGRRWENGEATIAQEHFATSLLRGRLQGLARGWGAGAGPRALLACPPAEQHDLGLLVFGLALRAQGWRIVMLGPNTPVEALAEAAAGLRPDLVVVASMRRDLLAPGEEALTAIAAEHRLALAGPGADAALARRTGALLVTESPTDAAAALAAEVAAGRG